MLLGVEITLVWVARGIIVPIFSKQELAAGILDETPLSYEEKELLTTQIDKLPDVKLTKVRMRVRTRASDVHLLWTGPFQGEGGFLRRRC